MKIKKFLEDYSIEFSTEGSNCQKGWVNINCPFCQDPSDHGGFRLEDTYYNCWKCGWHKMVDIISRLASCDDLQAKQIINKYRGEENDTNRPRIQSSSGRESISLPTGSDTLSERHRAYLRNRSFDAERIEREWGLLGTGPVGEYKHRIIAPIYQDRKLVNYQGRDITDKATEKYKSCHNEEAVIPIKHTLYGLDKCDSDTVVIVEGITDVWRLGPGAVAVYGIQFTNQQIKLVLENFKQAFIIFDDEEQAQEQAEELEDQLTALGLLTDCWLLPGRDPGELSDQEAKEIMKDIFKTGWLEKGE